MIYQNVGVSGGTITAEVVRKKGGFRHSVARTVSKMDADADYAILEGGVNDASLYSDDGYPLVVGKITEGYTEPLDDTTYCGAFESMLKELIIRFAGKKYGYIAVHKMTSHFSADYEGEDNFYLIAKKCCEKWGVPFLDLCISCPPFAYFKNDKDSELYKELCQKYTHNGDGWHPNKEGYEKYYCDKIEAWLKTL